VVKRQWLTDAILNEKQTGQTRKDIAINAGLSLRALYSYEYGERSPRVTKAKVLAKMLQFDWRQFYTD